MRINIGCGLWPTRGWRNFDNSPTVRLAGIPVVAAILARRSDDMRKFVELCRAGDIEYATAQRLPVQSGAAQVVYSSHMLEHLHPRDASAFLAEARRVLRPGGIIRLVLPDLEMLARDYLMHRNADLFVEKSMLATPECHGLASRLRLLAAGHRHHLWMYDGPSLCRLLAASEFRDPVTLPAGETRIANPEPLDLRERADQSVYVEAIR
jgi:SAM-dependent methyltransferase